MTDVLLSYSRVKAAARGVAKSRQIGDLADDLAHDVVVEQLSGSVVRLDRTGLSWLLHGFADKYLGRVTRRTVVCAARSFTRASASPLHLVELQEIYAIATESERRAIVSLMMHGRVAHGISRAETHRKGAALHTLRKKLREATA